MSLITALKIRSSNEITKQKKTILTRNEMNNPLSNISCSKWDIQTKITEYYN